MSNKQTTEITNTLNYFKIKDLLNGTYGSPLAHEGGPNMYAAIYDGGIILKSSKNNIWEKEFNKEEIVIPEHISKDLASKLIKLAQAA